MKALLTQIKTGLLCFQKKLAVFLVALFMTSSVFSNPVLNNVSSGNVTVQQQPNSTVINQSSQKAIINWNSFNINGNESTHFQQPAGGVALNRISPTQGASQIYGRLTATGQIILMNPAGIYFGAGAYVNVGGIIATTANMTDASFLSGNYQFSKVAGYDGSIINEGTIIAAQNGLVALVAPTVINNGLIQANVGKVILASGEAFTMNFSGDNLINFSVDAPATSTANRKAGVTNRGTLMADGGTIMVTAKTAAGVLDNVINMEGVAQARSVGMQNGEIILGADTNAGVVRVAGKLDVSGKGAGQKGGNIQITGKYILLDDGANLDASGYNGGGQILIGGNYKGQGPLPNATATVMSNNAVINADALVSGNGGKIILWSDYATKAYGTITAKGAGNGGNGGFVETSGKEYLDVAGISVNLSAPQGTTGMWLLDPLNVTISNSATINGSFNSANPDVFTPNSTGSIVNIANLVTNLLSANVTITTGSTGAEAGNITVANAITWLSPNTLTLQAASNIIINAAITGLNGTLALQAGGTITTGAAGAINVGNFNLISGAWQQVTGSLPVFNVINNFQISGGSFLRALSGNGAGSPYLLADVYGLQGMQGIYAYSNFNLNNDIDATVTKNWNNGAGFAPLYDPNDGGFNSYWGNVNGLNRAIINLTINRPGESATGLFNVMRGTVQNLALINPIITGDSLVGALAGSVLAAVTNVYVINGTITGNQNVGGLVGNNFSNNLSNIWISGGSVTGQTNVGGITGENVSGNISTSWNGADVSGDDYVGGITGASSGTILNVYSTGNVAGTNIVGGLVGNNTGTITTSYASGAVSGSTNVGGLVGSNSSSVTNSYWDTQTSGQATSAGGTGLTTAQSLGLTNYTGFDGATVWWGGPASNTRPILRNEYSTTIRTAHQLQLMGLTTTAAYTLGNDIDASGTSNASDVWPQATMFAASGTGFRPIALTTTGSLDGQNYTIYDLAMNYTRNAGTFDFVLSPFSALGNTGFIRNLNLINYNYSFNQNAFSGTTIAAGLVGLIASGTTNALLNIYTQGTITLTGSVSSAAGIANSVTGGTYSDLHSDGTITGAGGGGGIFAGLTGSGTTTLSGSSSGVNITTTGGGSATGGLIGSLANSNITISDSYATGNINASNAASTSAGGLIGRVAAGSGYALTRVYATGAITNATNLGGLVGNNAASVAGLTATNAYWDTTTTGRGTALGTGTAISGTATGLTTAQALTQSSYTGWTISNVGGSTWYMRDGMTRPILQNENSSTIFNMKQLQLMAMNPTGSYRLANDLNGNVTSANASDVWGGGGFVPIGIHATPFNGSLNGQGYYISNLTMNIPSSYTSTGDVGLIGNAGSNVNIQEVGLRNFNYTVAAGAPAGNGVNIGGLVGQMNGGILSRNYAIGTVTLTATPNQTRVGGLIGLSNGGSVSRSYADTTINVTATSSAGGLQIGGFIGSSNGGFDQNYSLGTINYDPNWTGANNAVGGFAGEGWLGIISNSYSLATINLQLNNAAASTSVGGFMGRRYNDTIINNSFSAGYLNAFSYNSGTNTTSTNISNASGFVGQGNTNGTGNFWNMYTSIVGLSQGASCLNCQTTGATGLTTSQMMTSSNFSGAGWDIADGTTTNTSIWNILPGASYPYLQAFYSSTPRIISGTSPAAGGSMVNLTAGDLTLSTVRTGADGFFYFFTGINAISGISNTVTDGAMLMAYLNDASVQASNVFRVPTSNGSLSGASALAMTANTLTIGGTIADTITTYEVGNTHDANFDPDMLFNVGAFNQIFLISGANLVTTANTTFVLDGTINADSGNMTFNGATLLANNVLNPISNVLTTNTAGNITFNGTLNSSGSSRDLAINNPGIVTFNGAVGNTLALTSLTTDAGGSTVINGGSVNTVGGSQTYNDAVVLGATTTLNINNSGNITFGSTLDGGYALTAQGNGNTITFGGIVGGLTPLASFELYADTININTTSINTTGIQAYRTSTGTVLGANVVMNAGGGTSAWFEGDVSSTGGARNLTINGGSGTIYFFEGADNVNPLNDVVLNTSGMASLQGDFHATSLTVNGMTGVLGDIVTSGNQFYSSLVRVEDALTTNHNFTSTGGSIYFGGNMVSFNTPNNLIINGNTGVTFGGNVGNSLVSGVFGNIQVTGPTTFGIGSNVAVYTTGTQTYNSPVTLANNTTLNADNASAITLNSTVNSTGTNRSLTLNTTGTTTFGGAVGNTLALSALTTNSGGGTVINGGQISTTGTQTYNDAVTLASDTTLNASNITFNNAVNSTGANRSLTLNATGTSTFNAAVGNILALSSLTTNAGGSTAINGGQINTTGAQVYNDAVTLGANAVLASTSNDAITFFNTINGAYGLTVNTTGTTFFGNVVGGTTPLASLTTNAGGLTQIVTDITTTGDQMYGDAVEMYWGGNRSLVGNNITFNNQLAFDYHFSTNMTGTNVTFNGNISRPWGGSNSLVITASNQININGTAELEWLVTNGTGTTYIRGGNISVYSGQAYNTPVIFDSTTNTTTLAAGGIITFNNTVNAATGTTQDLIINSPVVIAGILGGANSVGTSTALRHLTIDSGVGSTDIRANINTTGTQTYSSNVNLNGSNDVILTSTGVGADGDITFEDTVNGGRGMTVNTAGTTSFDGAVGNILGLLSLTTDSGGLTQINGGSINTTGTQTYNDNVVLGSNAALTGSDIILTGALDGGNNTVSLSNTGSGSSIAGVISNLTSLTKTGAGSLTLSGNNNYAGTTAINAGTLIASHANALGTIVGSTTVTSGAALDIRAAIGAEAVTISGTGISSGGALITGSGTGSLSGAVTLAADSSVGGAGNLTLSGAIGETGGARALTKVGAGTLTLSGTNTYSGGTLFNAGTLSVTSNSNLGNAAGNLTFNGGTLRFTDANFTSARGITLNAGGGVFDPFGTVSLNNTFTGQVTGVGALTINDSNPGSTSGGGMVTFSNGTNNYAGGTIITSGTFGVGADGALSSGAITINGTGNAGIRAINAQRDINNLLNANASIGERVDEDCTAINVVWTAIRICASQH